MKTFPDTLGFNHTQYSWYTSGVRIATQSDPSNFAWCPSNQLLMPGLVWQPNNPDFTLKSEDRLVVQLFLSRVHLNDVIGAYPMNYICEVGH